MTDRSSSSAPDLAFDASAPASRRGEDVDAADAVRDALRSRVRRLLNGANGHGSTDGVDRIHRVRVSLPTAVDPLDWLWSQPATEAVYWSGRDDDEAVAGVGAADCIAARSLPVDLDRLESVLAGRIDSGENVRYFGGLRFDAGQPPNNETPDRRWTPFGAARFVLPRFLLHRSGDETSLSCTIVRSRDTDDAEAILQAIDRLPLPKPVTHDALPPLLDRVDAPTHDRWCKMVEWALRNVSSGHLAKVVLARRVALRFGDRIRPFHVLKHLQAATRSCFHFGFRPEGKPTAWVGASPERLFRRSNGTVVSEAVAGTRSRGQSEQADAALRDELLESPKDRREHAFVEDAIADRLAPLCDRVDVDAETSEMQLERGRHLHSRIEGTLHPTTSTVDLLRALHPTPAVGGVPHDTALTAIRNQEPFDRGWYAGPIGWVGDEAAEFAVGIRAGLVRGEAIDLFSGAGLVEGSRPDAEWDEIEQKIGDFAAVLGIQD
jgi:menaquinone-specific isochorismate synthase